MRVEAISSRLEQCASALSAAQQLDWSGLCPGCALPFARLERHVAIYRGFLADMRAGRIKDDARHISELLDVVARFCRAIEQQFPIH